MNKKVMDKLCLNKKEFLNQSLYLFIIKKRAIPYELRRLSLIKSLSLYEEAEAFKSKIMNINSFIRKKVKEKEKAE